MSILKRINNFFKTSVQFDEKGFWFSFFIFRHNFVKWDEIMKIDAYVGDLFSCGLRFHFTSKKYVNVSTFYNNWESFNNFAFQKFPDVDAAKCRKLWDEIIIGYEFITVWRNGSIDLGSAVEDKE